MSRRQHLLAGVWIAVCAALVAALIGAVWPAHAVTSVEVKTPSTLDIDNITVTESAVSALTDLTSKREVMINNRTSVALCVEVTSADDCSSVTITCGTTSAGRDDDVLVVDSKDTVALPVPTGHTLCGKLAAADGDSEDVIVTERN